MISNHIEAYDIARRYFKSVGTPYALALLSKSASDLAQVGKPDPLAYDNHLVFARDYCCYTFLRKLKGDDKQATILEAKAIKVFQETEETVRRTNRHLRSGLYAKQRGVGNCIIAAQRKVAHILGRFDPAEWLDGCEWGPGSTSSLKGSDATLDIKILESRISVTARALPFYRWILENDIHMFFARTGRMPEGPYSVLKTEFALTDSSRLTTVEKSVNERRVIDIQPTANLFLQKGIGAMIRRRLKRHGVNLDDQSRNQWLASVAGRLGLATIDLAKASDTVSTEVIRLLLPDEWFVALDALRTRFTTYGDQMLYLHKFSAMGNGYTFELESLVFYALASAVCEMDGHDYPIGIYGDDIIVERHSAEKLIHVLETLGFETNREKSFLSGRFYESCGRHYFDGYDVTPLYQKERIDDFLSAVRCANRLYRHALRLGGQLYLDSTSEPAWSLACRAARGYWDEWQERRLEDWTRKRDQYGRRRPFVELDFPEKPYWVSGDDGLITNKQLPMKNWIGIVPVVNCHPHKVSADNSALLSVSLRRNCTTESPFLGFVTLKGRTMSATHSHRKVTYASLRVPDFL